MAFEAAAAKAPARRGRVGVPRRVMDPTCGGGAFLLAALDQFVARGLAPVDALARVAGHDIDDGAVRATRQAIEAWAEREGVRPGDRPEMDVRLSDALTVAVEPGQRPDVVLGNPPFATPLRGDGLPESAHTLRLEHAELLGPYADLAAVHLLHAVRSVMSQQGEEGEGGVVAFVLPQSLLSSRDVAGLREWLRSSAPTTHVWASDQLEFEANVRVFAPVLSVGGTASTTQTWAEQVAGALGVPHVDLDLEHGTLADLATATAGFRDEYYALAEAVGEESALGTGHPRLATVGAIDPLSFSWGSMPLRFAKQAWHRPVIDEDRIPSAKREWFARQRQPKVLLPTQSKIFEPYVDRNGSVLPVTPVISVHAAAEDLDRIAAVLLAPPVVAWAHRRWFGAALAINAIKLAAKDVVTIPLPPDRARWDEAASLVPMGPAALPEIAALMTQAYRSDDSLLRYWLDRAPISGDRLSE